MFGIVGFFAFIVLFFVVSKTEKQKIHAKTRYFKKAIAKVLNEIAQKC